MALTAAWLSVWWWNWDRWLERMMCAGPGIYHMASIVAKFKMFSFTTKQGCKTIPCLHESLLTVAFNDIFSLHFESWQRPRHRYWTETVKRVQRPKRTQCFVPHSTTFFINLQNTVQSRSIMFCFFRLYWWWRYGLRIIGQRKENAFCAFYVIGISSLLNIAINIAQDYHQCHQIKVFSEFRFTFRCTKQKYFGGVGTMAKRHQSIRCRS